MLTPHSFIRSDQSNSKGLKESELEREFGGLLESENASVHRPSNASNDLGELEAEFNNILFG